MKKAISTILALAMLATPLVGSTCFADKSADDVGAYVQNQERSEQYKLDKKTAVKAGKMAGCIAAGTAAVMGIAVAGLKICERVVPESIKEYLPFLFKKANKTEEESKTAAHSNGNPETVASSEEIPEAVAHSEENPKTAASSEEVPETVAHSDGNPETAASSDEVPETVVHSEEKSETVASSTEEPETVAHSEEKPEVVVSSTEEPKTVAPSVEEQSDKLSFEGTATKQDEGMLSKMGGWAQDHPVLATTAVVTTAAAAVGGACYLGVPALIIGAIGAAYGGIRRTLRPEIVTPIATKVVSEISQTTGTASEILSYALKNGLNGIIGNAQLTLNDIVEAIRKINAFSVNGKEYIAKLFETDGFSKENLWVMIENTLEVGNIDADDGTKGQLYDILKAAFINN